MELSSFQTSIKLSESRESSKAHPHDEVFVLDATSIKVGFCGVIGAIFRDLRERFVATRDAGEEQRYMYWRVVLGWP